MSRSSNAGTELGVPEVLLQCPISKLFVFSGQREWFERTVQMHCPRQKLAELYREVCKVLGSVAQSRKDFGMVVLYLLFSCFRF